MWQAFQDSVTPQRERLCRWRRPGKHRRIYCLWHGQGLSRRTRRSTFFSLFFFFFRKPLALHISFFSFDYKEKRLNFPAHEILPPYMRASNVITFALILVCLSDDDHSTVSAVLTSSGLLDATVSTASETYYVEPASRYFDASRNLSFPAVIYKASDVLHPDPHHHGSGCASHQLYLKQFEHFHCANKQENRDRPRNSSDLASVLTSCQESNTNNKGGVSEGIEPNQLIDQTLYSGWNRRHNEKKKKKRRSTIDHRKTTCMLYLQADHLFYGKMGSEEACIETMTRHVQRVNSIYKNVGTSSMTLDWCTCLTYSSNYFETGTFLFRF